MVKFNRPIPAEAAELSRGSWTVEASAMPGGVEICDGSEVVCITGADNPYINLIASVPDLYDALGQARNALATLEEGALGYGCDGMERHWPLRDELLSKMDAALRKARGEQ